MITEPAARIPWERRRQIGYPRAFWDTLVLSVRAPERFYALVPESSVWSALGYGVAFEVFVSLLGFAYHHAFGAAEFRDTVAPLFPQLREVYPDGPEMITKVMSAAALAEVVVAPLSWLFSLGITVAMTWVGLKLSGALSTSFARLVHAFGYASWIQLFGLLAITGDVFLGALALLLVVGFGSYYWLVIVRETQRVDTRRAIVASLYGSLVAFVFACFVGLPLLVAMGTLLYPFLPSVPTVPK